MTNCPYRCCMSKHSGMAEQLCGELRRAFQDLAATADSELRPLGITAGDRALLEFLARESNPISMSELARKINVSRQHIQQTIQRLPNQKWILSTNDPKDQRVVLIVLSKS